MNYSTTSSAGRTRYRDIPPVQSSADNHLQAHSNPGRPSRCTPEMLCMLKGVIRELGLSDSAAAVRLGLGASTISRWKREDPEVRLGLAQAREECRSLQLQRIVQSASAEHGRGWRAAAWMLERLFPEDYAASAGVREGHRQVRERREERERLAEEEGEAREAGSMARGKAEAEEDRAEEASPDGSNVEEPPIVMMVPASITSESADGFAQGDACRNCHDASAGDLGNKTHPVTNGDPTEAVRRHDPDRETACQNCRNAEVPPVRFHIPPTSIPERTLERSA